MINAIDAGGAGTRLRGAPLERAAVLRQSAAWAVLVVLLLVGQFVATAVSSPAHWPLLLRQAAPLGVLAIGQAVLIINRGFDLSVGGVVGLVNVVAASTMANTIGAPATIVFCLALGLAVGAVNGVIVVWGGLSPLIVTLGSGFVLTGLMLVTTGGAPSGNVPDGIKTLSSSRILGIAPSVYIWLAVALLTGLALRFSRIGRWLYASGSSPLGAANAGVPVSLVRFGAHCWSGLLAGAAGLLLAGFVGIGTLGAGQDLLLNSLAAAVIGGALLAGGVGGIFGVAGGTLLIVYMSALATSLGFGEAGNLLIQGGAIIAAALIFRRSNK